MDTSTFNTHMSDPKKNGLSFKNFGVLFKKICQIFNGKSPLRHKTSIYVLTEHWLQWIIKDGGPESQCYFFAHQTLNYSIFETITIIIILKVNSLPKDE